MSGVNQVRQCVTTLKSIEAQLSRLALQSQDDSSRNVFNEASLTIQMIHRDLQSRVTELTNP